MVEPSRTSKEPGSTTCPCIEKHGKNTCFAEERLFRIIQIFDHAERVVSTENETRRCRGGHGADVDVHSCKDVFCLVGFIVNIMG